MDTQLKLLGRDQPTEIPPIKHLKPSIDPVDAVPPPAARRRVLAEDPGVPPGRRGDVPRPHLAGEELDHQPAEAAAGGAGSGAAERSTTTSSKGFHRAPMSIRVSPYLLSLIDWADAYNDPLRRQFVPVASRLLPDHPKLTLDSLHEQADAPVPGPHPSLSRQGAVPRARHLPGVLPVLHAQLRGRRRHRRGREGLAQGDRGALGARVPLHLASGPSSRTSWCPAATATSSRRARSR